MLLVAAEFEGLVVITFDRDFRQLVKQVPHGVRGRFGRQAGRISLNLDERMAMARISELVEVIELSYELAAARGQRLIMQISETTYTVTG